MNNRGDFSEIFELINKIKNSKSKMNSMNNGGKASFKGY